MKCKACGYNDYDDNNDNFIEINGVFMIRDNYGKGIKEAYLSACPKCGTIRLEDVSIGINTNDESTD